MTKTAARYFFILCSVLLSVSLSAQDIYVTASVNPIGNKTYRINPANCDVEEIYTCNPTNNIGQFPENQYTDIAIDGQQNLYWVSGWGSLYKRNLGDVNSCEFLGVFDNSKSINALVADSATTLYAAGNFGGVCTLYKYSGGNFSTLGNLPAGIFSEGDLFFYEQRLFLTATDAYLTHSFLVEINTTNPELSCAYMELDCHQVFGAFSVKAGTTSKPYIISANTSSSSSLREIDIANKVVSSVICDYPFMAAGATAVYSQTSNNTVCTQHSTTTPGCVNEYFIKTYSRTDASINIFDFVKTTTNEIIAGGTMVVNKPDDNTDAFLVKLDANGEKVWEKHFSLPGYQLISQVIQLADGYFLGAGKDIFDVRQSFFLLKFDSDGNIIWKKSFEYTNDCNFYIHQVKENADGSIIAVAYHVDRCLSFQDRFVWLKFDATGNLLFAKSISPPGGINLTSVSDFIIKGGYSYLSGYYHDGNKFDGILMKIKNSNGVIDWSKYYAFANGAAKFSQIFPFGNNQLCVIGSHDINYTDTSLVMICDTSGAILSSKYFTYGSNRDVGKAVMDSAGDLVWFNYSLYTNNNLKNDLTITRLHPANGIVWSKEYPQLRDRLYFEDAQMGSDGSIFFGGNNASTIDKDQFFIGKISPSGDINCPPSDLPSSFGTIGSSVTSISCTAIDKTFTEITRNWTIEGSVIERIDTICQLVSQCNLLKISGPASICTGDTLVIPIEKNSDCTSWPQFSYNQSQLNLISQSNKEISFLVRDSGNSWIRAKIQMACDVLEDSVLIRLNYGKGPLQLMQDTSLCLGNTFTLNAGKGYTSYQWQDGSIDSSFQVERPGLYFIHVTDACSRIYKDTVLIVAAPPIPFDLGPDRTKCNNDTLHISAPSGFLSYSWSNNYNINSITSQNVVVNPSTDTAYYVKAEKTPGCFAYDTVRVRVNTSPPINLGADKGLCSGDSAVFDAGSGFNQYVWNNGSNAQQIIVKTAGSFSVTAITAQGCKTYDTVKVTNVFTNPVVSLDHTSYLCTGSSRILDAGTFASYLWNDGSTSQKIIAQGVGIYAVQVTDNNGCKGSDTARITAFLPLPSNFLPADTLLCSYDKLTIIPLRLYNSYQWNNSASVSSITVSQPGTYWLQVKDASGCAGRDTIIINPKDCMKGCYVPTAFTPNNDGKNDVFRPLLFGKVKRYQFTVYNRWGQTVFQTTELNKSWDGTVGGVLQDPNVFVWVCNYQFEGEEVKTEKGTVALVR